MLPALPRAVTPGPPLHLDRGTWRHHPLHTDALTVSLRQDSLLHVLPAFARRLDSWTDDTNSLINQFIANSPELWPWTKWNYLEIEDLRRVYCWLIRVQSRPSYTEVDGMVDEGLMESLERSYQHDRSSALALTEQFFHRRAQRLFRSLAEVSRQTESLRIGDVLANWFVSRAPHITTADNVMALGQWCFALLRATMRETDRRECLSAVLRRRPDLPSQLVGRGRKAEEVVRGLQAIENLSLRQHGGLRTYETFLGGPRANALLFDMELPHFRGRMMRSRPHNPRLLSPIDRLEPRCDVQDLDGRGCVERVLLQHQSTATSEQRLLQLNLWGRHADGLVRLDDLDDLALRDNLGFLEDVIEDRVLM